MADKFSLTKYAVLVAFNVNRPKLQKVDKALTEEQKANHAVTGRKTLKTVKDLYGDELKQIEGAIWAARADHYNMTLNWVADGAQLLPSKMYMTYTDKMRQHKAHIEQLISNFNYSEMIVRRKVALNGTFSEGDYPGEYEFKQGYGISLAIMPVPESSQFNAIADMVDVEVTMLVAENERRMADATASAMKEVHQRLFDVVSHVANTLKGGNCGRVHDSLLGNVQQLVDILPMLNVTDDPALEALRRRVEAELCSVSTESLKKDETRQKEVAAKAQSIMDAMAGFMGAY